MTYYLIIVLFILIVLSTRIKKKDKEIFVISDIDNKQYLVKGGYDDYQEASNILSRLNNINKIIIKHMYIKYKNKKYEENVESLQRNYNENVIAEHIPKGVKNTSYVLNKGDEIRLCLRDPHTKKLHSFETLLFVNLHELSHIFDLGWGHEQPFWYGFKLILQNAEELGLYKPIDYNKYPQPYCGLIINTNPYFSN